MRRIIHRIISLQQKEIREEKFRQSQKRSAINSDKLRKKFVDTALSYIGVPYARRYHGEYCELHPQLVHCCISNYFSASL